MLDKVFAAISMLGVVAFMGVVIIGVWEEIKAGGSQLENEPEHENKDD